MADNVIGLTLVKIDGIFELEVRNARWSNKRAVQQHVTGAGVRSAIGQEIPSGSFDEVIPKQGAKNWRSLKNFSIEIYDKETQKIVIASFDGCNWTGLDGSSDLSQANTSKSISWNGTDVIAS